MEQKQAILQYQTNLQYNQKQNIYYKDMSYILKRNQPLVNVKLTDLGRINLASGELDFSTFSLGDGEMDYTNSNIPSVNILRPVDNNHDILFPVSYNGSTYKVPITTITPYPIISTATAKDRGFFSGSTHNLIDYTLTSLYNLTGIISGNTNSINLKYVDTTISPNFVDFGVGTGYTTSLMNTGYTQNVKQGDYLFLKFLQHDYYTGHTANLTPYIDADPIQYLMYQITSVNSGTDLVLTGITNNQMINFGLDRNLPPFAKNCRVKGFIYPGTNTIPDYYDKTTPIAYWSNGVLDFTSDPSQRTKVDVPVWNMNIVNIRDLAGLDLTKYKDSEYSNGKNYEGTVIEYQYLSNVYLTVNPLTIVTGTTKGNSQVTGYTQTINKVGIIHYTNNTIDNFYGEGFYENSLTLTLPYLMWHKQQFGGTGLGNTIGYTFICDSTLKTINGTVQYYDLIDQEADANVVGKVLINEKIILIEDPELITAMSYKANRNWTLPTPKVSLVDVGHCVGANIGGALQPNEAIHLSYYLTNSKNVTGIQCENYQTMENVYTKAQDILFQFPKKATTTTYSEFSYLKDYGSENGLGFSADNIYLLWQKTAIGEVPDPTEWRKYNLGQFIGTNGCLPVGIPSQQQFYFRKDTIYLPKSPSNITTTYQPIGDVLVFISSIASTGSLLKQASSAANVGVDGDYWQYPLSVTGSTNGTPIFKINPIFNTSGYYVELGYLYGSTTTASTITQSVTTPSSFAGYTYLNGIYLNGSGNVCLTLDYQPNNNTVYLFKNGNLVSDNNYGVFTTGTTANRGVELTTFTPSAGDVLTLYYLDNSGAYTTTAPMTASNINNLLAYIDKSIIDNSVNDYYDIGTIVSLPTPTNITGLTFGDEVFFYGNVQTDIKATTYKTIFTFNVLPNTFVTSQNPTFDSNRNKVAFTEVGIYDASDNLVAIGKFSQPITRKYNSDIISLQATIDF